MSLASWISSPQHLVERLGVDDPMPIGILPKGRNCPSVFAEQAKWQKISVGYFPQARSGEASAAFQRAFWGASHVNQEHDYCCTRRTPHRRIRAWHQIAR
jgi:hypothetical protein